ncbi:MAG: putative bifunctional diguanylate cyclase/phosphodiesterase [Inhella sp.]
MSLPAFLDARRLEGRTVRLFLVLLLVVQAASFLLVRRAIENQAVKAIDQRLNSAAFILRRELAQRLVVEQIKAGVLVKDAGFIEVLGQMHVDAAGRATLLDALDNHGQRVGARMAAFVDLRGQVIASQAQAASMVEAARQLPAGEPGTNELRLALVDGEPLQLLRVPARAPGPVGEVVFAFTVAPDQLTPVKKYSNVDVAVGVRTAPGQWQHAVHAEAPDALDELLMAASNLALGLPGRLAWLGEDYRAQRVELPALGNGDDGRLMAMLWASLDEEMKPARDLQLSLLWLNLVGVGLFALGSVFTARRLSGPIQTLRGVAEQLGRGDYDSPVLMRSRIAEVGELALAFETMRQGIKRHQADIERYAYWDKLTGLPNRAQFVEALSGCLAEQPDRLALLVLNLDRFKPVNDALGRELGDRLLMAVAERLPGLLPAGPGRLVARLGGDEFALFVQGADAQQAMAVAKAIHEALAAPVELERRSQARDGDPLHDKLKVDVSASIGIAVFPGHGVHHDDLLTHAERAMDLAKRRQAGSLLFEDAMNARTPASLGLLTELRRAVANEELRLFLQPKQDLEKLEVRGAEALVRWQHPTRGMVPPGLFIPFAEETGFVRQLTQWVLRAAARHAADVHAKGLSLRIAVNLSTRDLLEADLLGKLQTMLAEEDCAPEWLCLEITESAIMDDPKRALETVRGLADAGFRLAIDDFGTGYSSLAYLQKLPVHEVKIDQSFVFDLDKDENNQTIVRSTIELSHKLGKKVVAEGVETVDALNLLEQWGCDEAQGYYIARPMPAEQLIAKLLSGSLVTRL